MGLELSKDGNTIEGHVSPGYESVRELFEGRFMSGREKSAQLCVYVGEEMVINLWHSVSSTSYTKDTLTTIFSSSKNLSAIAMAMLHEKGLLKYDAKIVEYWPEFTGQGKEGITVADVLRHEAGYAKYPLELENIEMLYAENIKNNSIGKLFEGSKPNYPKHGKREYHGVTRGFLLNEIFRRIEPSGCTIGEFLRREVSNEFNVRVLLGVKDDELEDYEPVEAAGMVSAASAAISTLPYTSWPSFMAEVVWSSVPFKVGGQNSDFSTVNDEKVRKAEMPSVCANASAQGLAKLAAFMANKGELGKERMMSDYVAGHARCDKGCMAVGGRGHDALLPGRGHQVPVCGLGCGRDVFWGWLGYGGYVFQWHPCMRIGLHA